MGEKKLHWKKTVLSSLPLGLFFALLLEGIFIIERTYLSGGIVPGESRLLAILTALRMPELILMLVLFSAAFFFCIRFADCVVPFVYKYRYCFAAAFVVICVVFSLSGSSIACWEGTLGQPQTGGSGVLFGAPQPIRSDEYNANTMMAFSQYYNQTGAFAYFADTFRGASTDMFIVYGQPVLDWAVAFRPFHWGYLLFDPARGLAFFWSLRFAALFMVSFEMGMLITKGSKKLSLAFSFLVSLAPAVQWWFAINGFVEMLIYVQLAAIILNKYLLTEKYWQRLLCAILAAWLAVSFVLLFYPAWQVPMFWVLVALIVWVALEARGHAKLTWKRDLPLLGLALVIIGGSLLYVLSKSGGTVEAVMNTAYPGSRVDFGGGNPASLFSYGSNIFLPVRVPGPELGTNQVELARFFDFFPMGLLMALWVLIREKQRDKLLWCLLAVDALLIMYCCVPFPEWLAKLTLLSQSNSGRTAVIVGFVNLLILFRALGVLRTRVKPVWAAIIAAALAVAVTLVGRGWFTGFLSGKMLVIVFVLLFVGFFLAVAAKRRLFQSLFLLFCIAVSLVAGGLVNPVQQGADVLYENPLVKEISAITHEDGGDGLWIVEGEGAMVSFPAAVGAPTINTVNVYPNLERWRILDPQGEYKEIYNRYAHISIVFTKDPTQFGLNHADQFTLHLNYDDIEKLGIRYVVTRSELAPQVGDVSFEQLARESGFLIYKTNFAGEE